MNETLGRERESTCQLCQDPSLAWGCAKDGMRHANIMNSVNAFDVVSCRRKASGTSARGLFFGLFLHEVTIVIIAQSSETDEISHDHITAARTRSQQRPHGIVSAEWTVPTERQQD